MKTLEDLYRKWCRETKRSGGVLVGGSIWQFFDWVKENNYKVVKVVKKDETKTEK
jgi:hypothetical protein